MSRINFITGELHGKLGEIVGSRINGKAYTKIFVPPKNPNTEKQQEIRACFRHLSHIGTKLSEVLMSYVRPQPKKMSAMNHLVKLNKTMLRKEGVKWTPSELVILEGNLPSTPIKSGVVDQNDTDVTIDWVKTPGNPDDISIAIVYNEDTGIVGYTVEKRSEGQSTVNIVRRDPNITGKIHAWLVFASVNGTGGENSNTAYRLIF
jgi:hypothetical protein